MTKRAGVSQELTEMIREKGPVPFSEFMRLALYSDPHGYYRRHVPGPGADYRTSPTISSVFGRLLARHLERVREALGRPDTFRVTEVGAGNGELARSVLESASAGFLSALEWCLVEPLRSVEKIQRRHLSGVPIPIQWVRKLSDLDPADGIVLANEVLDNMPFHVLEVSAAGFNEIHVGREDDGFVEVALPAKDPDIVGEAASALGHLEPGDRLEIRPEMMDWCREASGTLRRGFVTAIDYGDIEPDVWREHPAGTLVTYRKERIGFDPLADPGEMDITAHVNFSTLGRAAVGAGLSVDSIVTQREWLLSLGFSEIEEDLHRRTITAQKEGEYANALEMLGERSRAGALVARGGLGDLLVFIASKGLQGD